MRANQRERNMIIREATIKDNTDLLRLTEDCPMNGAIKLIVARKPDFFALLKLRGGSYKLFVAEKDQRIVGSFAIVIKDVHINSQPVRAGYLCDLKIAQSHRNSLLAYRLLIVMYEYMKTLLLDYFFCVIARGNKEVVNLLSGRSGIPKAFLVSEFKVFQFFPLKKSIRSKSITSLYAAEHSEEAICLLNEYYKSFQFTNVFTRHTDIEGDIAWVIKKDLRIVAFISLIDTYKFKQNNVVQIPAYLKILVAIAGMVWTHLELPKENEPIRMLYIKYLACVSGCEHLLYELIQKSRGYAYSEGYSFLSYGLDKRNPLIKRLRDLPKVTFDSHGYIFDFSGAGKWETNKLCHEHFFET
jgi:hypothetical protein